MNIVLAGIKHLAIFYPPNPKTAMTFYLLNINEETTASLLLGHFNARDGTPLLVLYDIQEGSAEKLQPYMDDLLKKIENLLHTSANAVVLVYHRLHYSGAWYTYKPALELQDAQSLDFLGFDTDIVRAAAKDTVALNTIHVQIEGLAKETSHTTVFKALEQLWAASNGEHDFKERVSAWSAPPKNKDVG